MSIFKCKMCGGTIEFEPGATVGVCDSCGTKQTLPRLDDDRRANLYDRANHFRRNNEYDKAAGLYEQILNEDNTDAEAYWSLVLCRYGIEYVEDPATHKRVPTVNRAQYTSIFDDDNYRSALQYADGYQKSIYEEEAAAINEIQKSILAISQKEQPFDVFICYKETDDSGRRTQDSVLANDLYHQLTQEGFKVFFSRITLEDKLGTAYEPYIFAALNSAKVMVALGTKPAYFNAVWVKNEWSRYLALVRESGGKKVLIPAYRDMDPYDLPEEFSHLQALDMSKLGFMQDLIRGIKKIVRADEPKTTVKETVVMGGGTDAAPLLKRAFIFLEDGNFTGADEYCERVLDQDPENAQAYLGKLMVEKQVRHQDDLADLESSFEESDHYQKAMRYGDDALTGRLSGYINAIKGRIYDRAALAMEKADTEADYQAAAEIFKTISGFRDADEMAKQCADNGRKDSIYVAAVNRMTGNKPEPYQTAIEEFRSISGWKDANEKIVLCQRKIEEIRVKEEHDRLEKERKKEEARIAREQAAKKTKKALAVLIPVVCACFVIALVVTNVILPRQKMNQAMDLLNAGDYDSAYAILEELGNNDAIISSKHDRGMELLDAGKFDAAYSLLEQSGDTDIITSSKHDRAIALLDSKDYDSAYALLKDIGENDIIASSKYERAISHIDSKDYKQAVMLLQEINYEDSSEILSQILPQYYQMVLPKAAVGDVIQFGSYPQLSSAVKRVINWRVLAKENNRLLVISESVLDCQEYNTEYTDVTWATCSLRSWLNYTFLPAAFTEKEQSMIPTVTITADPVLFDDGKPSSYTNSGNDTQDQVFLLSTREVKRYFASDADRQCSPTEYAVKARECEVGDSGSCCWWLRTPGVKFQVFAAQVSKGGFVNDYGVGVNRSGGGNDGYSGVRPALWIDLGA